MTLFGRQQRDLGDTGNQLVPSRSLGHRFGAVQVTNETAMRHSAVWACRVLRANLVASTPLDVFRRVGGVQVESPRPALFAMPGGERVGLPQWLWATQYDLDGTGNTVGIITKKDGNGFPAEVELQNPGDVTIKGKGPNVAKYVISGKVYEPELIWHETAYQPSGSPIGLSPVAAAAWSIGGYLSAQQFALDWFAAGPHPKGRLKNTRQDILGRKAIETAKSEFKAATYAGELFVHGANWEYTAEQQVSATAAFLEELRYGAADVCRFFGVPADMVDAGTSGSSVTYANVTQRNLQFLIMHLGPAYQRREWSFSQYAMAQPRYAKFNTDAILRMDPQAREQMLIAQVAGKVRTASEVREIDNLPPYTEEQFAEFDRLFPPKGQKVVDDPAVLAPS